MLRITPEIITELNDNEVMVFGANAEGSHWGGAARVAYEKFGAVWGEGIGKFGRSYAIPTLIFPTTTTGKVTKMPIEAIDDCVKDFIKYATEHPELTFYVTPIGCGIAGFQPEEIAPLFFDALLLENVYLPQSFITILMVNYKNIIK